MTHHRPSPTLRLPTTRCRSRWLRASRTKDRVAKRRQPIAGQPLVLIATQPAALPDPGPQPTSPERQLVARALDYLRTHVEASISVNDLAVALHVSSRTLQRALRNTLDRSPKDVILEVKMDESRRLLATGGLRVSEVAYRLGFASADHFSRRFKSYHGVTPSSLIPG